MFSTSSFLRHFGIIVYCLTIAFHTIAQSTAPDTIKVSLDGIDYLIVDGQAHLPRLCISQGSQGKGIYNIPATIEYNGNQYPVTKINKGAFQSCDWIKSIKLPESITVIEDEAFSRCTDLQTISLGSSVTSIGDQAFSGCESLLEVVLPNSVTSIGSYLFDNCSSLESITLSTGLTELPNCMLRDCTALEGLTIPASVNKISGTILEGCTSINELIIEDSDNPLLLTSPVIYAVSLPLESRSGLLYIGRNCTLDNVVGDGYFYGNYDTVVIGDKVTELVYNAFKDISYIKQVTLGKSLSKLGTSVFANCTGLTEITIPESMTIIPDNTFKGCTSLRNVNIPSTLTTIGVGAFEDCRSLHGITIPGAVKTINRGAFANSALTMVSIQGPMAELSLGAFLNCQELTTVSLPETLTKIGDSAFENCLALKTIEIPNGVSSIGKSAFENCSLLTSIVIPENVTELGVNAFTGCFELDTLVYNATNCTKYGNYNLQPVFPTTIKHLTIGENVISIPDYFLFGGSEIKTLIIPNSVENVGFQAFNGQNLKTLVIGKNAHGNGAFNNSVITKIFWLSSNPENSFGADFDAAKVIYSGVERNDLPNALVYPYLSGMFQDNGIVYVPNSPIERTCDVVDYVTDKIDSDITIPSKVNYREMEVNVSNIGNWAFANCVRLKTVEIDNGVKRVGESAFAGCDSLKVFSAGHDVAEYGNNAFSGCVALSEFYSRSVMPPTCAGQSLADIDKVGCILFVPDGCSDAYRSAEYWKSFFFIEEMDAVLVSDIILDLTDLSINIGDSLQLSAKIYPEDATNKSLYWHSTDPNIVSVDENGMITAIREGEANIIVNSADGNAEATCRVTVTSLVSILEINVNGLSGRIYDLHGAYCGNDLSRLGPGAYIINSNGIVTKILVK